MTVKQNCPITARSSWQGCFKGASRLVFYGNDVDLGKIRVELNGIQSHKPVSPLMGSVAPCCGGRLSGNFSIN